jgi:hypothetical protein
MPPAGFGIMWCVVDGCRDRLDPGDFGRADLERLGFIGFATVRYLRGLHPLAAVVPDDAVGVYVAYRESDQPVSFLRHNPAGHRRAALDPSLSPASLRARWVELSRVVYIGKADRPDPTSGNSLQERVRSYLRQGAGHNAGHSGGSPTWQLRDSAHLLIAWRVVAPPIVPRTYESDLIIAHVARFNARPFANTIG